MDRANQFLRVQEEQEDGVKPAYEYANFDVECAYEVFNENAKYYRPAMTGIGARIANFLTNPSTIKLHISGIKNYDSFPSVPMPSADKDLNMSLQQALAKRRSNPSFGSAITAQELANLLSFSLASNYKTIPSFVPDQIMYRKPFASGGGLYPVEFYVLINDVVGLEPCIAHFDWINNSLKKIASLPSGALNRVMTAPFKEGEEPSVIIFMSGVLQRSTNKYGNKGYKFVMIEAGCAGQTLQLVATSLGLNSLMWNSFFDTEVEDMLGIDGVNETVITSFVVGKDK